MQFERGPSSTVTSDSDQRRHLKSPRRSDEDEGKEHKRQRGYCKEEEWKAKANKYGEDKKWETNLARAKRHERSEYVKNKAEKVNKQASYVGTKWSSERQTSGRSGWTSSSWTPSTAWETPLAAWASSSWTWDEDWPKQHDYMRDWTKNQHDMIVERRKKGADGHVIVRKERDEEDTRPFMRDYKLITNEEAKDEYDPSDKPGDMDKLQKALGTLNATTVVEGGEKQPQVVSGANVAEVFEGGYSCAHLFKFRNSFRCETCEKTLEYIHTFANFTMTTLKGVRKYQVVEDVDAKIARAHGENFKNIATAKGYLGAEDEHVRQVHICIDCAEKIASHPQAFADGTPIKHDDPVFKDSPKIHHVQKDNGQWVPSRKWRKMATASIAPPSGTDREKRITHIMEGIARKMEKDGMTNLKTPAQMKEDFDEEEEKLTAAASD